MMREGSELLMDLWDLPPEVNLEGCTCEVRPYNHFVGLSLVQFTTIK